MEKGFFGRYDNAGVRRQDRLLDAGRAEEILRAEEYGVLSMVDGEGDAYGIPISYVWDGASTIYLHCAPEGRKLRCITRNPNVSFCVVGNTKVALAKFTTAYESIVIKGKARIGLPESERMHALEIFLEKYDPANKELGMHYAQKSFHRTEIIRIDIENISGKCKVVK